MSSSEKQRVIGVAICLETVDWSWNRTIFSSLDIIERMKIFFSELVYDQHEEMRNLFNRTVAIKAAYVDDFGTGQWLQSIVHTDPG